MSCHEELDQVGLEMVEKEHRYASGTSLPDRLPQIHGPPQRRVGAITPRTLWLAIIVAAIVNVTAAAAVERVIGGVLSNVGHDDTVEDIDDRLRYANSIVCTVG